MNTPKNLSPGVVVGVTLDTKGEETEWLCEQLRGCGLSPIVVDCGVLGGAAMHAQITADVIAESGGVALDELRQRADRAQAIPVMMRGLEVQLGELHRAGRVQGYIGIGGGTNAALASAAFRVLPFGIPKLLVSTNASGDTRELVGIKDVVLMHSVVDILGLGSYLKALLSRAARVMAALVVDAAERRIVRSQRCAALTAFGSTTPAANHAYGLLKRAQLDVLTFHARGIGGLAAEAFIEDGVVDVFLDLTTTEIADEIVGGVRSAGPSRMDAAANMGIPQVVLPGAIDMVNFGARATIPTRFEGRKFLEHTPFSTLMRTTAIENESIAKFMAAKLRKARGPVAVILPLGGHSAYDAPGKPFYDPASDAAFRDTLKAELAGTVTVFEIDRHINHPMCAELAVRTLIDLLEQGNAPHGKEI